MGLIQANSSNASSRQNMALLFAHEVTRVFHDRLVDDTDRTFFKKVLYEKMDECLQYKLPDDMLTNNTLMFGDFADLNNPTSDRTYQRIEDVDLLSRNLQVNLLRFCHCAALNIAQEHGKYFELS